MIRAYLKLSLRDRIVIGAAALGGIVAFVILIFRALSGTPVGNFGFPESILQKDSNLQVYHRYEYREFPTKIQFPGTDYGLDVGGDEIPSTSGGAAFKLSDDMYIIVADLTGAADTASFVTNQFYKIINGNESLPVGEYEVKVHDEGYLNTLLIEYEGGILEAQENKYYVLTYRVSVEGRQFLLAYATPNKGSLKQCFYYLNHMLCTLCKYEDESQESEPTSENVHVIVSDTGNSVQVDTPTIELYGGRDYETFEDVQGQIESDRLELAYPNRGSIIESVNIDGSYRGKQAAVAFEYTYGLNKPSSASITSPSNTQYDPEYFNDENDGRIVFVLDSPEPGVWSLAVADDADLGEYAVHVMDYMDYIGASGTADATEIDMAGKNTDTVVVERNGMAGQEVPAATPENTVSPQAEQGN